MPLDYMLRVIRVPSVAAKRRDEMAKAAAPFVHSKLASIENRGLHEDLYKSVTNLSEVPKKRTGVRWWRPQQLCELGATLEVVFVIPPRRFEDL